MSASPHIVVQPTRSNTWCYAPQGGEPRTAGAMPVAAPAADGEGGFMSFVRGFLDIINPLQHIPVVSTIYRNITGDEISPMARIAGGTLFGGPLGGGLAAADCAFEQASGATVGDTVASVLTGTPLDDAAPVAMASAAPVASGALAPTRWYATPALAQAAQASSVSSSPALVSLSAVPAPDRMRTANNEPAKPTGPDTPAARQAVAESATQTVRHHGGLIADARLTTHASVDAALSLPDAPADPRTGIPPELMAMKMQEALSKYAAMKSGGL